MTKMLRLAPGLALPPDFATQGVAVVGVRGSGKSNTEARWVELLYEALIPWVVVDPKGDWHGIRSSADGTAPGLSVPVFGGLHGNFPLEAGMGVAIADLLVDHMLSAVLDVSQLSKTGGQVRFLLDFFRHLMERHKREPHVRCVVLEEAHRYIPQLIPKGSVQRAELKEAAAAVLLEGRSFGLGCWAATQRPARLHKDVLEEVTNVILHGLGVAATNDKKAVKEWTQHYDLAAEIMASLNTLAPGEAWVLSPQVLKLVKRVMVDRRRTFDSGATPTVGARVRVPTTLAEIDAGVIEAALADVIERAKADDPAELRKQIKVLERALREANTRYLDAEEAAASKVVEVMVEVVPEAVVRAAVGVADWVRSGAEVLEAILGAAQGLDVVSGVGPAVDTPVRPAASRVASSPPPPQPPPLPPQPSPRGRGAGTEPAPRRLLMVLATHGPMTQARAAFMAEVSSRKSTLRNAMSTLRGPGLITEDVPGKPGCIGITEAGLAELGDFEALPTGPALLEYWRGQVGKGKPRDIFEALLAAYPDEVTVPALAERLGIDPGLSTLRNGLSTLRSLGVVEGNRIIPALMEAIA